MIQGADKNEIITGNEEKNEIKINKDKKEDIFFTNAKYLPLLLEEKKMQLELIDTYNKHDNNNMTVISDSIKNMQKFEDNFLKGPDYAEINDTPIYKLCNIMKKINSIEKKRLNKINDYFNEKFEMIFSFRNFSVKRNYFNEKYEEEEAENQPQTEEIEEAEANEEQNERETEENEKVLNSAIIESLTNRTKKLEEENNQLKQDIQKISSSDKGGALEYFTSIRKELFNSIEDLNKQIKDFDKNKAIEEKKTKREMDYINGQFNDAKQLNQNLKAQLETLQNQIIENDNLIQKVDNVELKNLPNNGRMEELDYQINALNAEITKNEYLIKDQTETINELEETFETQTKDLNEQYEEMKNKYHNLLGASEITEDIMDKEYNEKTKEFRKNMEENNKLEKEYHEKASTLINIQQEVDKLTLDTENLKQKNLKILMR